MILTELLANTTLSDIENEVNEDGELEVRRLSLKDVKVSLVKPSLESLYPDSLIVLSKKVDSDGGSSDHQLYSVTRYWKDVHNTPNWIQSEHMFDL